MRRVVLTSSIAAITGDFDTPHKSDIRDVYDETDWTDTSRADLSAYFKSKVLRQAAFGAKRKIYIVSLMQDPPPPPITCMQGHSHERTNK